jgi:thiol-disulfide isomerase/thioredoxin
MKTALLSITESTFARQVLAAPLPVVVLFGVPACPASRALRPWLRELACAHAGQLRIATINVERNALIAEQFGVQATPELLVVQHGEVLTRVVGFLPAGLLRLLCEQVAAGALPPDPFWSPTEATFEDVVVLPLLDRWGFTYMRQAPCPAPSRGRVEVLVYDPRLARPVTLFENKRRMLSAQALGAAVQQAHAYARALRLPAFVLGAPAGLGVYASVDPQPVALRRVTSLELERQPEVVPQLLRSLSAAVAADRSASPRPAR